MDKDGDALMGLLESIHAPGDIRALSYEQMETLAREIRARVFDAVSHNGGHLASNLGIVELTLALHYVYDFGPFPKGPDRLLWDVGHQSYPHKLLTGRAAGFDRLRQKGSVGGFPNPDESPYDLFAVGHAGTAISTAVGMARGDAAAGRPNHVVAVVGDASIVNGMAFEGLNNAGTLKRQLLIVLNDNGMSISRPQGAFSQYLERVRVSTTYDEFKKISRNLVGQLPTGVSARIEQLWHHFRDAVKSSIWPGQIFESFGVKYMGPIDGHDLPGLINTLAELKHVTAPVLLHVKTIKGKGYSVAASEPTKFHSPSAFDVRDAAGGVSDCRVEMRQKEGKSWTTAFADAMIELGKTEPTLTAMTAGMPDGTGLSRFEKVFPDRYYDTGICESHLMGMAAGMAKAGRRPVAAIYSTFMQRAFDQVWQEVVLNHQPVILAMDRAGYCGGDGAVHHGFMDLAFLRPMPDMVLMAPSDEAELNRCLRLAVTLDNASALRYPRDNVPARDFEQVIASELQTAAAQEWRVGQSRVLRRGNDAVLIVYGALATEAMKAAAALADEEIELEVIDARFCKPLDGAMLKRVLDGRRPVLTLEDHSLQNGFGSAVLEYAVSHHLAAGRITRLGHPDRLIAHASRQQQLNEAGLDALGVAAAVRDALRSTGEPPVPRHALHAAATK